MKKYKIKGADMKIIINNHTKDLTDATCLVKVYQFLTDTKTISELKEFNVFMAITFEKYVCIVRHLKNGYSFEFKNKE